VSNLTLIPQGSTSFSANNPVFNWSSVTAGKKAKFVAHARVSEGTAEAPKGLLGKMLLDKLEQVGGSWPFKALFNLNGDLIPAIEFKTRFRYSWGIFKTPECDGRVQRWVDESTHRNPRVARERNLKKGFTVGIVEVPVKLVYPRKGRGLSSREPIIMRVDDGFSLDARVVCRDYLDHPNIDINDWQLEGVTYNEK